MKHLRVFRIAVVAALFAGTTILSACQASAPYDHGCAFTPDDLACSANFAVPQ